MPKSICYVCKSTTCECKKTKKKHRPKRRDSARDRGYDGRWDRESKLFLSRPENQICVCGCGFADVTDHIVPHQGDWELVHMPENWQPMARGCNTAKNTTGFDDKLRVEFDKILGKGLTKLQAVLAIKERINRGN